MVPKPRVHRVSKKIAPRPAVIKVQKHAGRISVPQRPAIQQVRQQVKPTPKTKTHRTQLVPQRQSPTRRQVNNGPRPAVATKKRNVSRQPQSIAVKPQASKLKMRHESRLKSYYDKIMRLKNSGKGKVLVILGCGPSVSEVDFAPLKHHPLVDMMTINKPNLSVWPTKYWAFCDNSQYKRNKEAFEQYDGMLINSGSIRAQHRNQVLIRNKPGKGFSRDLIKGFYIGRSTVYANMQTALYMNYDKIYIFGMDMCRVGDKLHFYGVNPDVPESNRISRFQAEAEHYFYAAGLLKVEDRSKFYICSKYNPWPFVEKFNRLDHNNAVDHILNYVKQK